LAVELGFDDVFDQLVEKALVGQYLHGILVVLVAFLEAPVGGLRFADAEVDLGSHLGIKHNLVVQHLKTVLLGFVGKGGFKPCCAPVGNVAPDNGILTADDAEDCLLFLTAQSLFLSRFLFE